MMSYPDSSSMKPFSSSESFSPLLTSHSISRIPKDDQTCCGGSPPESSVGSWCGRSITKVSEGAHSIVMRVIQAMQNAIHVLGSLTANTNMLAGIFRRLNGQVLAAVEQLAKLPAGTYNQLKHITGSMVGYVDTIQVATDVSYFASGRFKQDNNVNFTSRVFMAVANMGGALLWFQEMSFISLSKAASAIGDVRLFGIVPAITSSIPGIRNIASLQRVASAIGEIRVFSFIHRLNPMETIALRALTLAYVFMAVDAAQRLASHNGIEKTQAALDLSNYLSELALDALLTIGVTNVVGLGVVGAVCIATALAKFAYKASM